MTPRNLLLQQLILALVIGTAAGCIIGSLIVGSMALQPMVFAALVKSPTPTSTATPTASVTPTITRTRTPTRTATPLPPTPVPTTANGVATAPGTRVTFATRTPRAITPHFLADRPVAPTAQATTPALFYLYGTTGLGNYDVHHGEEFVNDTGTPLYAVADGTIVTAGSDRQPICGEDGKTICGRNLEPGGYYDKLVVIQLAREHNGQKVFALYGHMSKINVTKGDSVKQGDVIGEIGATGVALGPHVHFEIRLGANDYAHTRNPILWMIPLPGRGALAGRYNDTRGTPVRSAIVNIYRPDGSFLMSTETYGRDRYAEINPDDEWGENFAVPDLVPGEYKVTISGQQFAQRVTIQAGRLSFVEIGGP